MLTFNLLKKLAHGLVACTMMLLCIAPYPAKHMPKDKDNLQLTFSVLSDVHIESNNLETYRMYFKIMRDAKKMEGGNDAIVFLGDNTMNGQDIESMFFYGALNAVNPADEIIVASGNHDFGNGNGDYEKYEKRYINYNNFFFHHGIDKPYYYKVINDCYFIVLATESDTVNLMDISETQLQWLGSVLNEAQKTGKPIFIFNHYPVDYIDDYNYTALADVIDDYDNVVYFSGHTHNAYGYGSVSNIYGINHINLPKCTEHALEDYDGGIGAQVEVYSDEVVVRIRDFADNVWLDEYIYEIN
ncbi:MAG: metallophosphoesterase [Clostridia bacterium]|nr:metallophosphoesterase [Clostridia bacterium]